MSLRTTARTLVLLFIGVALSAPAFGQVRADYEAVFIPIAVREIPGALGSIWSSTLYVQNSSDATVEMPTYGTGIVCRVAPCNFNVGPHTFDTVPLDSASSVHPDLPPAVMLYVPKSAHDLHFNLRIQDLSRQSETWGTEIPVIRESQLRTSKLTLIGIPVGPLFRSALRIYGPSETGPADEPVTKKAHVVIRHALSNAKLNELDASIVSFGSFGSAFPTRPAMAQFPDLGALAYPIQIGTPEPVTLVNVEITPISEDLHFWAFVSATNNATQHVTTITPQE